MGYSTQTPRKAVALEAGNFLSPRETAVHMGVTLTFVYHEIASGHFPGARKAGKRWGIPVQEVEAKASARRARGMTW